MTQLVYLYLLSPLHTGGTTQEGNLLGIARESHTNLPYIPSSTIRGRLRASTADNQRSELWGNTIDDVTKEGDSNLTQGQLWIGDGSLLWVPVPSLSHGVIWVSSRLLLKRWQRLNSKNQAKVPDEYSNNFSNNNPVYLKDAILPGQDLKKVNLQAWIPQSEVSCINHALVLPDQHCATLIQMCLWRQVKIKLDEHKTVDGGFRYEEAIPPDTLMYFPWGITTQAKANTTAASDKFEAILAEHSVLQIGGQESLGRGFVKNWSSED
ncbi:type III-B CRISPR module RAMP protein Cmr4 [Thermosynechococcaceae cyanobacterium BACA0444]|uniref:Type III-B CRISPR module RAMP protein Cmr4 n=1 Tax=Pseudocalidococcus azoricus BACA0444 TaxID=2918990 RepID=A0AAE4FT69_9CYAN|nr:type III-B CRISPR module RAMP protein Cmr4 [Pseudocalidococcus azoricus]MDS3861706.1 type III-B CRISPR module RAMP protein Cmr4 [Pseudocalidococcus azoricus BACA0444]